ncbi:hypothetical protein BDF22DRAFT_623124 [Syncephalis plumigaleata]|nr:hypothetical protein BDF22DRAFT_623124 [Syncephalis plumigaleata]
MDPHTQEEKRLAAFVSEQPNAEYILDAPLLCRDDNTTATSRGEQTSSSSSSSSSGQHNCIRSKLEAKEMFAQMQKLGYFCQLPPEPNSVHFICRRV